MSLSYSENSKHVIEQIEYLNSIVSDLETQIDLFQNTTSDNIGGGDWKLTIKNGKLRIETGIKSIADLLLHCPPIPFQIPKTGLVVEFNPRKNTCLRILTSKLLMKCLDTNQNTFISLPTSFLLDARSVMDRLIHIYFECHNTFNPLIHQPSFLDYYKQLVNPLDSLLCLCICCHVCGAPCQHTHGDLTSIGRYFSGLAKMKLMDQFDVKEKRIENMISINLLGSYLHFLLLNRESKKIAAINYQIAMDLFPWYKRQSNSVEGALYSRNVSLIVSYQKSMGLPDEGHSILQEIASLPWRAMDDENRELVDYVDGHNHLLRLYHHSIMFELKVNKKKRN
jgi:hypothetical protein